MTEVKEKKWQRKRSAGEQRRTLKKMKGGRTRQNEQLETRILLVIGKGGLGQKEQTGQMDLGDSSTLLKGHTGAFGEKKTKENTRIRER